MNYNPDATEDDGSCYYEDIWEEDSDWESDTTCAVRPRPNDRLSFF